MTPNHRSLLHCNYIQWNLSRDVKDILRTRLCILCMYIESQNIYHDQVLIGILKNVKGGARVLDPLS